MLNRIGIYSLTLVAATALSLAAQEVGTGNGVSNCNCLETDVTGANVPHKKTTLVTIRANKVTGTREQSARGQNTGQSGDAYTDQTISPGKCKYVKYVKYVFVCHETNTGWTCWLDSFSPGERDATEDDCPEEEA